MGEEVEFEPVQGWHLADRKGTKAGNTKEKVISQMCGGTALWER
jgi:hypothetical protein